MSLKQKNFVAIDLEFNTEGQIIQIGAAYGDVLTTGKYNAFMRFIKDTIVDDRITDLTGIEQWRINIDGQSMERATNDLKNWIDWLNGLHGKCFINALTWGGNDSLNLASQSNEVLNFGSCVIDVKHVYRTWLLSQGKYPVGGIDIACKDLDIPFHGRHHDASDDAINTLNIYRELIKRFKG